MQKAKILDTLHSIGTGVLFLIFLSLIVEVLLMALYTFSLIAFGLEKEPPIILLTKKCMSVSGGVLFSLVFMMLMSDALCDLYRKITKKQSRWA